MLARLMHLYGHRRTFFHSYINWTLKMFRHDQTFIPLKNKLIRRHWTNIKSNLIINIWIETKLKLRPKPKWRRDEKNLYYIIINFSAYYCWIQFFLLNELYRHYVVVSFRRCAHLVFLVHKFEPKIFFLIYSRDLDTFIVCQWKIQWWWNAMESWTMKMQRLHVLNVDKY